MALPVTLRSTSQIVVIRASLSLVKPWMCSMPRPRTPMTAIRTTSLALTFLPFGGIAGLRRRPEAVVAWRAEILAASAAVSWKELPTVHRHGWISWSAA